jgi:hypothetical protein
VEETLPRNGCPTAALFVANIGRQTKGWALKDLAMFLAIMAIGAVVFLPLHVVAVRAVGGARLITTLIAVIGASTIAAVLGGWLLFDRYFSSAGAATLAYVAAALCFAAYAGLYSLLLPSSVDRSVSVHIVKLLYLAPNHRMTEAELFSLYTHGDMLEKRFNDCLATGIIKREGEELVLTPQGARIAWLYMTVGEGLGMRLWYLDRLRKGVKPFAR